MAVSLVTYPGNLAQDVYSAYEPFVIKVSSNAATIARMRFDIKVTAPLNGSESADEDMVLELDPDLGSSNAFTFDLQDLKFMMSSFKGVNAGGTDMPPITGTYKDGGYAIINISSIIATEILADAVTGILSDGATLDISAFVGNPYTLLNNIYWQEDAKSLSDYVVLSVPSTKKFLTSAPNNKFIRSDESEWLGVVLARTVGGVAYDNAGIDYQLWITTYDIDNAAIGTYKINIAVDNRFFQLGVGPVNLNNATLATGSQPVVNNAVVKYEATLYEVSSGNNKLTETRTYILDRRGYDTITRFHFINKFGAIDSFSCIGEIEESVSGNSEQAQRQLANSSAVQDRGAVELGIEVNRSFGVNAGALNTTEIRWLRQLVLSQNVFVQEVSRGSENFVPVIMKKEISFVDSDPDKYIFEYAYANNTFGHKG